MKYGVMGTGMVGRTLGTKLRELGHEVMIGSRTADNKDAKAWLETADSRGRIGTFQDAARFGEVLMNCTSGAVALDILRAVERNDLNGKVLIDVSNPLDFSRGMPPTLSICNTDSLGESLQRQFPEVRVVKALNTVNCQVMVHPSRVKGEHDLFICGNDAGAKAQVAGLLQEFGWKSIIDLGDITSSRATEQLMPIWIRLYGMYKTGDFNFKIVQN